VNLHFDHDLDLSALRGLVGRIAADRAAWRPLVNLDVEHRHYAQLWRGDHLDVWVISWMNGHDTGYHDHDLSAGAVAVIEGAVREERLLLGPSPAARTFRAGSVFDFAAQDIHRVLHAGDGPAVTLHAYSPPLWRMGAYLVEPDGALRRQSISYAEELRPITA
jgi:predicted metal-dependent enzyme (double-stranded beta helix superfamily)